VALLHGVGAGCVSPFPAMDAAPDDDRSKAKQADTLKHSGLLILSPDHLSIILC